MQVNEPFELGLIRTILGLSPDGDLAAEVRRIKKENEKLRKMLDHTLSLPCICGEREQHSEKCVRLRDAISGINDLIVRGGERGGVE